MKKLTLMLTALFVSLAVDAQTQMRLWQGGESTRINLSDAETMTYSVDGTAITIAGLTYQTADIDSLTMIHQVPIVFSQTSATAQVPAAVVNDITVATDGANVTVTNTNVSNEVEFILSGESANGSFTYNGAYKVTFILDGLSLTSQQGAAFNIQCGKRISVVLAAGTTNRFVDATNGTHKACFYSKGHVELEGNGTLEVTGKTNHAIQTKEYLQLKKSTGAVNVLGAVSDALHIGQYYQQNGGTVSITSTTQGDGIQVDLVTLDDDVTPDPDKEQNGQTIIKGGNLNIAMTHEDCKGIKSAGDITISGGMFDITASGNGSRGIQTDTNMVIGAEEGTTSITVRATGGRCTNEDHEDDPHRCMGIKVDGNLTVNGGTTVVTNTGNKSRGIKIGGTYTKNGGTVSANIK